MLVCVCDWVSMWISSWMCPDVSFLIVHVFYVCVGMLPPGQEQQL